MKILSKYKDYYDYLVGVWGEDPLIVLDRRNYQLPGPYYFSDIEKVDLFICDKHIQGLHRFGKFYYGKDIEPFAIKHRSIKCRYYYYHFNDKKTYSIDDGTKQCLNINKEIQPTNLNTKLGIPILMYNKSICLSNKQEIDKYFTYPILKDLGLQSYISPEDMWLMMSDFLAKKDNTVDKRTDKEKILSKGFDFKTSFRGK